MDLERFCKTYSSFEYRSSVEASSRSTLCCVPITSCSTECGGSGRGDRCLSNGNLDPGRASGSLRFDSGFAAAKRMSRPRPGPGMFHRDSQELLDQPGKDHLARKCLRRCFSPLAVLDVGARAVPSDELARFVEVWRDANEKPIGKLRHAGEDAPRSRLVLRKSITLPYFFH